MSSYTYYKNSTGEIVAVGECVDGFEADQYDATNNSILIGEIGDANTQYVLAGILTTRPTASTFVDTNTIQADGFDIATISGVPAGWAYVVSNGASGVTDGTDIQLTALEAGIYTIRFTNWPYQNIEYTINASATPL